MPTISLQENMHQNGEHESKSPLIPKKYHDSADKGCSPSFLRDSVKWVLKFTMWVVFVSWIALMVFFPSEFVTKLFGKFIQKTDGTEFGVTGSLLLAFSCPVFVLAILAVCYLLIKGDEDEELLNQERKAKETPRFRLWTFPILVDGPFGVVSATEFIGIVLFAVWLIWATSAYTIQTWKLFSKIELPSVLKTSLMLEIEGLRLGTIGIFCLALLFIPVSRGSVLLRVINIPFEHATRYHVWLGHLTMFVFTLHGMFYVIAWAMQGRLLEQLLEWKDIGVANLAGVISLGAGLLMWATSLNPVRKHRFELFFYTHQLYILFVVFLAFHVGDFIFCISLGGIFLFMLDRFLRFCQSRRTVAILSATSLPCGSVELVLSKPPNLQYNALSFIFLQVREMSWLQWHPFSVSSSPMEGKHHMSVLIKVLGSWTEKLKNRISNSHEENQEELLDPPQITASVEGPYGHESPNHLRYKHLVLVAGGIGISPFLAVLSDIFIRNKMGKSCRPKSILIVWAIKASEELSLLSMLNIDSISPSLPHLDIQIFVTRESNPSLEEGKTHEIPRRSFCPAKQTPTMSSLVGTGDNVWVGLYVVSSIVGFLATLWFVDVYYLNPFHISCWWYEGILLFGCMIAGVVVFGGFIVILWRISERRIPSTQPHSNEIPNEDMIGAKQEQGDDNFLCQSSTIRYGCRPDFNDVLGAVAERWGQVDIGVFVCGPSSLQTSVAREIRSKNLKRRARGAVFHFNSHSFDL